MKSQEITENLPEIHQGMILYPEAGNHPKIAGNWLLFASPASPTGNHALSSAGVV
jgi:hypothetical protein